MLRYRMNIQGNVQGVGFRYFAQKTALLYSINGWVRNRYDGTVEIDAEGSEINISGFIKSIEKGNRFANVESINLEKKEHIMHYKTFNIID